MKKPVNYNGREWDLDVLAGYMDDDLREELHSELSPCTPQEFIDEYCLRHEAKFDEPFDIN